MDTDSHKYCCLAGDNDADAEEIYDANIEGYIEYLASKGQTLEDTSEPEWDNSGIKDFWSWLG